MFLKSVYYKNEDLFKLVMCFYHLALRQVDSGRMLFLVGNGGNGKGMLGLLEYFWKRQLFIG